MKFQTSFLFFISLLVGCTVGPNYRMPVNTMPEQYIAGKKNVSEKALNPFWWEAFNDPVLVRLINQAVQGCNYDIQKSHDKVRQARAALGIANADLYPQLNASGSVTRQHLSANSMLLSSIPIKIPYNYTDYTAGFDASWELDFFGGKRRATEAATARLQSVMEQENNLEMITAAEVARTYIQYRVYQQRIKIAKHTIGSYGKTAKLIKLQSEAGSATGLDVQRINSEVLSSQAVLPSLEAESRASLNALAVLVGEYPEDLYKQLNQPAPIPVIKAKSLIVGLPSDLLRRRPDIRAAERELAATNAEIGVATANLYPRFQLIGNLGIDTVFAGTFADAASRYWSWGPQISLPIFQGGRLKQAVKERQALRDAAFATYKQTILQALSDVESSLIRYDRSRIRKRALFASLKKIRSAENLVMIQYRDGQATLNDVLDVERQVDQINDQYIQTLGQEEVNLVALYKALGGSWIACKT